jgi:hypothetical protein
VILWCIGGDDAAEEAQDDGIERSVPGAAGPDHQHEARAGSAGRQDRLGLDQREIAPLYSENGRPGIETRFVIGLLLLKHIYGLSDEGVGGSTTRISSSSPAKSSSRTSART